MPRTPKVPDSQQFNPATRWIRERLEARSLPAAPRENLFQVCLRMPESTVELLDALAAHLHTSRNEAASQLLHASAHAAIDCLPDFDRDLVLRAIRLHAPKKTA